MKLSHLTLQSVVLLIAGVSALAATPTAGDSNAKPANQIKVMLFGQPCVLQGSLDPTALQAIHAVSPEQTYTLLSLEDVKPDSPKLLKQNIERLTEVKVPQLLERYRQKLSRRLEAQLAFVEGLRAAESAKKSAPLLSEVKKHLVNRQSAAAKRFEASAKQLDKARSANLAAQLFESYNELIEPDPEEEFHRVIQRLGAQYVCAFEQESEHDTEGEPEPEVSAQPAAKPAR